VRAQANGGRLRVLRLPVGMCWSGGHGEFPASGGSACRLADAVSAGGAAACWHVSGVGRRQDSNGPDSEVVSRTPGGLADGCRPGVKRGLGWFSAFSEAGLRSGVR